MDPSTRRSLTNNNNNNNSPRNNNNYDYYYHYGGPSSSYNDPTNHTTSTLSESNDPEQSASMSTAGEIVIGLLFALILILFFYMGGRAEWASRQQAEQQRRQANHPSPRSPDQVKECLDLKSWHPFGNDKNQKHETSTSTTTEDHDSETVLLENDIERNIPPGAAADSAGSPVSSSSSLHIPVVVVEECAICIEEFKDGEFICHSRNRDCPHVFHPDCIIAWLQKHERCPLCRIQYLVQKR